MATRLVLLLLFATVLTVKHPHPTTEKCLYPFFHYPKDEGDDSNESDFPDNEQEVALTVHPPGYYTDPYLDQEGEEPFFPHGVPPLVNFIILKHHYSNETNLAFPAYVNALEKKKKDHLRKGR